jgi:sugar lactone lactonase YvrE
MIAVDEYDKRTVKCDVDARGYLSNLRYFAEKGEFSSISDKQGNIWVADGEIYGFDAKGNQMQLIQVPERPSCLSITELADKSLYFTGRAAFYRIKIR